MTKIPEIYAEWIPVLAEFAAGHNDKEVIPALQQGRVFWCDIVGWRLSSRLYRAFSQRIKWISGKFGQAQDAGMPAEQALSMLEKDWQLIFSAAQIQCLPKEAREKLQQALKNAYQNVQQSLQNSAQQDPDGELAIILQRRKAKQK